MKRAVTYEQLFKRGRRFRWHNRVLVLIFILLIAIVYFIANRLLVEYESVQPVHAAQAEFEKIKEGDYWHLIVDAGSGIYSDVTRVELFEIFSRVIPERELSFTSAVSTVKGEEVYAFRLDDVVFAKVILSDSGKTTAHGFRIPAFDRVEHVLDLRTLLPKDHPEDETVMEVQTEETQADETQERMPDTAGAAAEEAAVSLTEGAKETENEGITAQETSEDTVGAEMSTALPVEIVQEDEKPSDTADEQENMAAEAVGTDDRFAAEDKNTVMEPETGNELAAADKENGRVTSVENIVPADEAREEDVTEETEEQEEPAALHRYTILVPEGSAVAVNGEVLTNDNIASPRIDTVYNSYLYPDMPGVYDTEYFCELADDSPIVTVTDDMGNTLTVEKEGPSFAAQRWYADVPEDVEKRTLLIFQSYCAYFCNYGDKNSCYYLTESDSNAWNMIFEYSKWGGNQLYGSKFTDIVVSDYIAFSDDLCSVRVTGHVSGYIRTPGDTSYDIDYVFYLHRTNGVWKVYDLSIN